MSAARYIYCREHRTLHPVQFFWRCAHHPSAIENFFEKRTTCEWGCHTQELKWYHHGMHPNLSVVKPTDLHVQGVNTAMATPPRP